MLRCRQHPGARSAMSCCEPGRGPAKPAPRPAGPQGRGGDAAPFQGHTRPMTWIYVAQLLVPIGLVFWLLAFGPASRTGFWVQITASLLALAALTRIGIWLFPPWWTPHLAALVLLGAAFWRWRGRQRRQVLPSRVHGWLALLFFGWPVEAPCTGSVVAAVDGLADMQVPKYDRQHLAGKHVLLACEGLHVILAHLRRGSVRVSTGTAVESGAPLGEVGNSGGTNEPHLHIHAQRPGPLNTPMGGDPLPIRFDGRFLVRGDRISMLETNR